MHGKLREASSRKIATGMIAGRRARWIQKRVRPEIAAREEVLLSSLGINSVSSWEKARPTLRSSASTKTSN